MSDFNGPNTSQNEQPASSNAPEGRPRRPLLAIVLLGLAAVFVAQKLGIGTTDRWWTVFILIPAAWALVVAARFYRATGWTPPAIGSLIGGILLMGLWAKLFFGGMWHGAAMHAAAWHGHGFHGHFLIPILLVIGLAVWMRRSRWRRG